MVERVLAELRAGRPVIVTHASDEVMVLGIEALEPGTSTWFGPRGRARLVLSASRLRRLGIPQAETGVVPVAANDGDRIHHLALGVDARLDSPVGPASVLDDAALELMHLALLLPAALVAPVAEGARALLLRVTIREIEQFRQSRRTSLSIVSRAPVPLEKTGACEFVVFRGGEGLREQVAVIVGKPDPSKPVPVRLHSACLTGDLFGSLKCDCGDQLRRTVQWMAANQGGVLLYLDQEGRGNGIANKIRAYKLQSEGFDTYDADEILGFEFDQRHFDFAAEMLRLIGIARVRLLTNNPEKIAAMKRAGLDVDSAQRVNGRPTAENQSYLASKRDRAGHFIDAELLAARASD